VTIVYEKDANKYAGNILAKSEYAYDAWGNKTNIVDR